jgi:hypothetical protein
MSDTEMKSLLEDLKAFIGVKDLNTCKYYIIHYIMA